MQISQLSHVFKQAGTCVQGLHNAGLLTWSSVQLPAPLTSDPSQTGVAAPGMSQQPKQSQPLGVSAPQ